MSRSFLAAVATATLCSSVFAQVSVKDAWVRATVPQQSASGAFMQLSSATDARLVAATSSIAGVVEVHEMKMAGNVMTMGAVDGIALPAGKTVELKPGGYHLMLMDLKQQLKAGETVPITLVIEAKDKSRESVQINAPVRQLGASGAAHPKH